MPLLYISPCVLQKTVDIYTLVPSSLLDRKKIYINSPCTNANIYIEIINNLLAELKKRLKISIFLWRKSCASR